MPFTGNRIYIIAIIVFVFVIGVIAYAASQPKTSPIIIVDPDNPEPQETVQVTVKNSIGIDRITVTNLNTGQIFKASLIDLPLNFNCTRGDYIKFIVTTQQGYEWNAWWFTPVGTFDNHNPLTISADNIICVNNKIIMTPKCLILPETSTPEPTPYTPPIATYTGPTPTPITIIQVK